jgi:hypothetical protein
MTLLNHLIAFALYYFFEKVLKKMFIKFFNFFLMNSLYFYVKFGVINLLKTFHSQIFSRNCNCVFIIY